MLIHVRGPLRASTAARHVAQTWTASRSRHTTATSSRTLVGRTAPATPHTSHQQSHRHFANAADTTTTVLPDKSEFSDVVIVGAGVVGLALACSLAASSAFRSSGASITLVEASALDGVRTWSKRKQNDGQIDDWENRAIYLTSENHAWLRSLGIDKFLLEQRLNTVRSMHVTDGVTGAALDFDAPSSSKQGLGSMIEISNAQQALLHRLEELAAESKIKIHIDSGRKVEHIQAVQPTMDNKSSYVDAWPHVYLEGQSKPIKARLLVGADGHNSPVRKYAGIGAHGWPYERMGVVGTVKTHASNSTAFQRFLPTGTLAWLPLSGDTASLVWTLPPDIAKAVLAMQRKHEASAADSSSLSPFAHLVTAGFRLPWTSLSPILTRLASEASLGNEDGRWIEGAIQDALEMMASSSNEEGIEPEVNKPPAVSRVFDRSTAAFPLKLSHAEAYLGSSMRQTTFAEAGMGAFTPSNVLQKALDGVAMAASLLQKPTSDSLASQSVEKNFARGRTALIGDAAHTIHPLAGQGLNLGIADARSLGEALIKAASDGADLGSHLSLQAYPRQRYIANQAMLSVVDKLHWLFVVPPPGSASNTVLGDVVSSALIWGRSTGFEVLNELDIVKQAIIGAAGSEASSSNGDKNV